MYLRLDAFYERDILIKAKNHMIQEFDPFIEKITRNSHSNIIKLDDAILEISLNDYRIEVLLNRIPDFLLDEYQFSNIIEYNKYADAFHMLDLNKPPKSFAAKTEVQKAELFLIAKILEKAILLIFNLDKLSEFQFYMIAETPIYLGTLTRIRMIRDAFSGIFSTYDCLIFSERFKIEKKHVLILKDILELIDKEDYCLENLPNVLDELETLAHHSFIDSNTIFQFEEKYRNLVKIPKRPIFYRVPFLAWDQKQNYFYVSKENISEVIY